VLLDRRRMGSEVTEAVFWATNDAVRVPGVRVLGSRKALAAFSLRGAKLHNAESDGDGSSTEAAADGGSSSSRGAATVEEDRVLRVATWNLLAPPYARNALERSQWRERVAAQQAQLAALDPDVAALQEFWTSSDENVELWSRWAAARDYALVVLPRTGGKQDGCATLVKTRLVAPDTASRCYGLGYDDWGDRVCLVVPLPSLGLVVGNTHWTFAHDNAWDPSMRRHQARKLAAALAGDARVVVLGDLNGDATDPALVALRARGYALGEPPRASHLAHTGALLKCDFVATRGLLRCCPHPLEAAATSGPPPEAAAPPAGAAVSAALIDSLVLHGDERALAVKPSPEYRVSDHLMLSATLPLGDARGRRAGGSAAHAAADHDDDGAAPPPGGPRRPGPSSSSPS